MSDPATEFLTLDQVAAELKVSLSTVEGWVRSRELGSFKNGRNRRISREQLTRFVVRYSVLPDWPDWLTLQVDSQVQKRFEEIVKAQIQRVAA